jgi:hypothetical protein
MLESGSYDGTIRLQGVQTGQCLKILRREQPYESISITHVQGLTIA